MNEQNSIEFVSERELAQRASTPPRLHSEEHGVISEDRAFLSSLRLRIQNAEWDKFERDSEAFFDINHDLERLAKAEPELAEKIWTENAPPGVRPPLFLQEQLDRANTQQAEALVSQLAKEKGSDYELPASLRKRYLEGKDGDFHFRENKNVLAFRDSGKKISTEHSNPDVAASMVELAQAKGWDKIRVTGADDFKREVWLQASLKNIEVKGYTPKDVDLAKLEELRKMQSKNVIELDGGRSRGNDAPKTRESEHSGKFELPASDREAHGEPATGSMKGQLVEHGRAPYEFDERNEESYFVRVQTAAGSRIAWGTDLERAMGEAGASKGGPVELSRLGKEAVTVNVKQFDEAGRQIGIKPMETERVKWSVDTERTRAQKESQKPVELNADQKVAITVMSEVLKAKGYSQKTIEKATATATAKLTELEVSGKSAPRVKVYDPKAERDVQRIVAPSRSRIRENERTR